MNPIEKKEEAFQKLADFVQEVTEATSLVIVILGPIPGAVVRVNPPDMERLMARLEEVIEGTKTAVNLLGDKQGQVSIPDGEEPTVTLEE